MDNNENTPRRDAESKNNENKKPRHKFNRHRRPQNVESAQDDYSPNGAINVKPGRYDIPISESARESSRSSKDETTANSPARDNVRSGKGEPANDSTRDNTRPGRGDSTGDGEGVQNKKPRQKNQRRQKQFKQNQNQDAVEPRGLARTEADASDSQPPRDIPKSDKPDKFEKTDKPDKSDKSEKSDKSDRMDKPDKSDERRTKGQRPHRRQPYHRERGSQKNVSRSEIGQITEEEEAIVEYIAVTETELVESDAEIVEELNSIYDISEAPGQPDNIEYADNGGHDGDSPGYDTSEPVPDSTPEARIQPDEEGGYLTEEMRSLVEPPEPPRMCEIVGVRFKSAGKIYYFDPNGRKFSKDDPVIVDTARGLEFGIVDLSNRMVTEREVVMPLRQVIRPATPDDIARAEANAANAAEAFGICNEKIAEHKLEMKLVDVEYTFDNSKLLFYFTADGRVDFRELVKDLASVFRTRIELRQIGIRDETKLLGGLGICGRPFCCKTFLSDFVQVSIKMAKEQNLSLNSVKISGTCGRLMCCLRYEYDTYQEEIRRTPKVDQVVSTPDGDGIVIEVQPLAGLVRVKFIDKPDTLPKVYHRDNVTVIGTKGQLHARLSENQSKTND